MVELSGLGKVAALFWIEIPDHHEGVQLDEFVIMPNHIHGIVVLSPKIETDHKGEDVGTLHATSLQSHRDEKMAAISPRRGSLSVVMRSYKSAVTRWARRNGYDWFAWQSRFYDHIIRNENSLRKIRSYINTNPLRWELDRFYSTESN